MSQDCIFCDIAQGRARAKIVYDQDGFVAFENINPQAPVHLLVCPKDHIDKKDSIAGEKTRFWDDIFKAVNNVINKFELDKTGYRLVLNGAGYHAVNHEHIHLLGGENWRPDDDL